ncbi:hypothetical protein [Dyadobacter arcticus]|uniref:Uncharacterized protein n=1 Tax=Dyadobacter arcticus TaxID=1078754 RepID=A0ABX0ULW9_9BACT|nr:hypothetical protein [Dyadobacter arcticus]NIJ54001.1 hypothetical protein [Dyadobacter arcticus]
MKYFSDFALFITGEGAVRLFASFGNVFLLFIVFFLICMVIKFMHQD